MKNNLVTELKALLEKTDIRDMIVEPLEKHRYPYGCGGTGKGFLLCFYTYVLGCREY